MNPRKKGNKWEVQYRVPGYPKAFYERFDTEVEARLRCAQIEIARKNHNLMPPASAQKVIPITMSDLLDEYVQTYGLTHWGDSYYSLTKHRIEDYIKPAVGNILVRDITPRFLDECYKNMLNTQAKAMAGHKDVEKKISYPVIVKCHCLIRSALNQAVRWGYIQINPAVNVSLPRMPAKRREVWTPEQALMAINLCTDPNLKTCILLAIGCSLRLGEILGLQWKHVHIDEKSLEDNSSTLEVKQELKRCYKNSLEDLEKMNRGNVYFKFPDVKECSNTSLVLKIPKTESSIRTVYIPNSVAVALQAQRAMQEKRKELMHGLYSDYGMVIALDDGRPTEGRVIDRAFKELIVSNGLPEVVFHSLRHLSTSMKLQVSGGDIKAVQGDTGHAQASMVTQVYSHTFVENRKRMAGLMEDTFFSGVKGDAAENSAADAKKEQILDLLKESPELADLILAIAGGAKSRLN